MKTRSHLILVLVAGCLAVPATARAQGRVRKAAASLGEALVVRGTARVKAGRAMRRDTPWVRDTARLRNAHQMRGRAREHMDAAIGHFGNQKTSLGASEARAAARLTRKASRVEFFAGLAATPAGWKSDFRADLRANRAADREAVKGLRRITWGFRLLDWASGGGK